MPKEQIAFALISAVTAAGFAARVSHFLTQLRRARRAGALQA